MFVFFLRCLPAGVVEEDFVCESRALSLLLSLSCPRSLSRARFMPLSFCLSFSGWLGIEVSVE